MPARQGGDSAQKKEEQEVQIWERSKGPPDKSEELWLEALNELEQENENTKKVFNRQFIEAAYRGAVNRMNDLIFNDQPHQEESCSNVDVNAVDPRTGATTLHYVAAHGARPALRLLIRSRKCDFLIRDKRGRLASELAGIYGHDPAVARLLLRMENQQARAQGIRLRRRQPS